MNRWVGGWMDGWMDGQTDGYLGRCMDELNDDKIRYSAYCSFQNRDLLPRH